MPSNPQLDAPFSLFGLFPPESDDENDSQQDGEDNRDPCYEVQTISLVGVTLQVRQFDFHSHNANRVWPGTFNLAEYLLGDQERQSSNKETLDAKHPWWGSILELGTATGLLAVRLALASTVHGGLNSNSNCTSSPKTIEENRVVCSEIVTSDVQDEHDEIRANLKYNYKLNNILERPPIHVPHTWGTGWASSTQAAGLDVGTRRFDTIVASDILLYVSAYPALVETLKELMPHQDGNTKFVMSWNRRMKESSEFFDLMQAQRFDYKHEGKCIYTFVRAREPAVTKEDDK